MACVDIIVEIIFSCLLFFAQITLIIVHILNHKSMKVSNEISKNSFQIVKSNYLASIRPDFQIITQIDGYTPIDIDSRYITLEAYYKEIGMSIYPNWWGSYRFVYLKNVGNGPAFHITLQNFYAKAGETITIQTIAQGCEFIVFYIPDSEFSKPTFEKLKYFNSIARLVGITDSDLSHGVTKLKITFDDIDGNNYSYPDLKDPY